MAWFPSWRHLRYWLMPSKSFLVVLIVIWSHTSRVYCWCGHNRDSQKPLLNLGQLILLNCLPQSAVNWVRCTLVVMRGSPFYGGHRLFDRVDWFFRRWKALEVTLASQRRQWCIVVQWRSCPPRLSTSIGAASYQLLQLMRLPLPL